MAFIEIQEASFTYPNGYKAVENLSLSMERGESVAIVGQNGAGKTTAVKLLNGLHEPTLGNVIVDGWNTKGYTTAQMASKVAYVFQNPDDQIFNKTVYDEIAYGAKLIKLPKAEVKKRVEEAASLLDLTDVLEENPYDLPLQMRKIVAIASVVVMDVDVYIFDEPTAGQDQKGNAIIAELLSYLTGRDKSVITISHDMDFVAKYFPRTIVMASKEIIEDGDTRDIFWSLDSLKKADLKQTPMGDLARELGIDEKILMVDEMVDFFMGTYKKEGGLICPN